MNTFPQTGEIFNQRYELLEVLGTGGIGTVFKALQIESKRKIALKILHKEIVTDKDFKKRFIGEAKALNQLHHDGIVTVYHIGISDEGLPYIAMELIRGRSIKQVLKEDGALPALRATRITKQVADALAYVHAHGIIHRDLKPDNIILLDKPEDDTVKIIDFGLARFVNEQKTTRTGTVLGSVEYMSPEQCQGKTADARSEVYSLAVCFYQMLTLKKPFSAESAVAMIYQHSNTPVPKISAEQIDRFHPSLNKLFAKAMAKSPDERFQSMEEFSKELSALEEHLEKIVPASVAAADSAKKKAGAFSGHVRSVIVLVSLIAVCGAGLVISTLKQRQTNKQIETAVEQSAMRMSLERALTVLDTFNQQHRYNFASRGWSSYAHFKDSDRQSVEDERAQQKKELMNYLSLPKLEPAAHSCFLAVLANTETDPKLRVKDISEAYTIALNESKKGRSSAIMALKLAISADYARSLLQTGQPAEALKITEPLLDLALHTGEEPSYYKLSYIIEEHSKFDFECLTLQAYLATGNKQKADAMIKRILNSDDLPSMYQAERLAHDLAETKNEAYLRKMIESYKGHLSVLLYLSDYCFMADLEELGELALSYTEKLPVEFDGPHMWNTWCYCHTRSVRHLMKINQAVKAKKEAREIVACISDLPVESSYGYPVLHSDTYVFVLNTLLRLNLVAETHKVVEHARTSLKALPREWGALESYKFELKNYLDNPDIHKLLQEIDSAHVYSLHHRE